MLQLNTLTHSGSVRQLPVRVASNLVPPLLSIMGTICSYRNQPSRLLPPLPLHPAPLQHVRPDEPLSVCESGETAQKLCLCRKRNLEQVRLNQMGKNRACLCAREPSRSR
ncbi:hypothetical protein QQF64_002591 [Cirrhinus molitorella]|uniref:Uncharacterized protein n=1 Tax=Cirrhinus molitorella TaxID=172907 RepID=A0ABR3MQK7_9TELE